MRGIVTDTAGIALRGATVRIAGTATEQTTGADGRFSFERVRPGSHELVATLIGFQARRDSALVRPGETLDVALALRPAKVDTVPPAVPRGTAIDSVPTFADEIDAVARVARLPRLRPTAARASQRELRLWVGFGITDPMQLLRITVESGRVAGELWQWARNEIPDAAVDSSWRETVDSLPVRLRRTFACDPLRADTLRTPDGGSESREQVVACRVRFASPPDWAAELRALEALDVWTLPDETEVPQLGLVVFDGISMVVEAWNGARYRSYHYGNPQLQPSPESRQAAELMLRVQELAARR